VKFKKIKELLQSKKEKGRNKLQQILEAGTVLKKIQLGFTLVVLLIVISSGFIFINTQHIFQQLTTVREKVIPATKVNSALSADTMGNLAKMYRAQAGLGTYQVRETGLVNSNINELKKYMEQEEINQQLNELKELNEQLKTKYRSFNQAEEGSYEQQSLASKITDIASSMRILNAKITSYGWEQMEQRIKTVVQITNNMRTRIFLLTGISLLLGIILGVLITKGIQKLTFQIKEKTFQASEKSETITEGANEIQQIADDIDGKLSQAVDSITDLMNGNEEVSTAVEEVAVAIQDVSQGVEDLAEQAEKISKIGNTTYQAAEETAEKINQGDQLVEIASEKIKELQTSISNIDKISEKIMQITDQTNLLALNAAIEAARAGSTVRDSEAGKGKRGQGFTVVAEEIKDLAEESKEATQEVQKIIEEITEAAEEAVNVMLGGEEAEDDIVNVFAEIDQLSIQVLEQMEEIKKATDSQVAATEEVSALTEEISASSQQVSAQTEETLSLAEKMKDTIETVNTDNNELYSKVDEQVKSCNYQEKLMGEVIAANKKLNK